MLFILELLLFQLHLLCFYLREIYYGVLRNRPRKELKNNHILITGTGMGMGNELVNILARDGNTIHCVDISAALNDGVREKFSARTDCTIHTYVCDVSDGAAVTRLHDEVVANCGAAQHLEYMINNAGIVYGKLFSETPIDRYIKVIAVNALGPMHMCKVFYEEMLVKGGHIVNIASVAGLGPAPRMVDYAASKHAVVGFSRGLQFELDSIGNTRVKITTIFPHLTKTGMFNGCVSKLSNFYPALEPAFVAQQIVLAMKEEREEMQVPKHNEKFFILQYILGSKMFRALAKIFGNYEYMDTFKNIRQQ